MTFMEALADGVATEDAIVINQATLRALETRRRAKGERLDNEAAAAFWKKVRARNTDA